MKSSAGTKKYKYVFPKKENDQFDKLIANSGVCLAQGDRPNQEDRYSILEVEKSIFNLSFFRYLPKKIRSNLLANVVSQLQNSHGDHGDCGSTLCSVFAWRAGERLAVDLTNVGDSSAYLVIIGEDGKVKTSKRLNALHHPHPQKNPSEYNRVRSNVYEEKKGSWVLNKKLLGIRLGYLAVARAIGDSSYERRGLSHKPEILQIEQQLSEGSRAYIILTSDGLDKLPGAHFGELLANNPGVSPAEIAKHFVFQAYDNGSRDNLTAIVMPIEEQLSSACVFDGHGGDAVSDALSQCFYTYFIEKFNERLIRLLGPLFSTDSSEIFLTENDGMLVEALKKQAWFRNSADEKKASDDSPEFSEVTDYLNDKPVEDNTWLSSLSLTEQGQLISTAVKLFQITFKQLETEREARERLKPIIENHLAAFPIANTSIPFFGGSRHDPAKQELKDYLDSSSLDCLVAIKSGNALTELVENSIRQRLISYGDKLIAVGGNRHITDYNRMIGEVNERLRSVNNFEATV